MARFAMVIDLEKCFGCHTCSVSCKAEFQVPDTNWRCWVKRLGPEDTPHGISYTFYPGLCGQCNKAVCVDPCPVPLQEVKITGLGGDTYMQNIRATWKDPLSGIVRIDSSRCIGCGACVEACPYGARFLNSTKKEPVAEKCDFCFDRLLKGKQPYCVETCMGEARLFGNLDDPDSPVTEYVKKGAIRLTKWGNNLEPNVYYWGQKKDLFLLKKHALPK